VVAQLSLTSTCHCLCRFWVVPTGDILQLTDGDSLSALLRVLRNKDAASAFALWDKVCGYICDRLKAEKRLTSTAAQKLVKLLKDGDAVPFIIKDCQKWVMLVAAGTGKDAKPSTKEFKYTGFKVQNWTKNIDSNWAMLTARMEMLDYTAAYRPESAGIKLTDELASSSRRSASGLAVASRQPAGEKLRRRTMGGSTTSGKALPSSSNTMPSGSSMPGSDRVRSRTAKRMRRVVNSDSSDIDVDQLGAELEDQLSDEVSMQHKRRSGRATSPAVTTSLDVLADAAGAAGIADAAHQQSS
jgi:hypothetical protein